MSLATTGEEDVEKGDAGMPVLILMDIRLPGQDGYESTRAIRHFEGERGADVPVIPDRPPLRRGPQETLETGCDDYHAKPVHFSKLVAQIKTLIEVSS